MSKALQDYTFVAKNAQYIPEKKRRETWTEAVYRVRDMHLEKYKDFPDVHTDIEWAFEKVRQKKILGAQRALQFGGPAILKKNARLYNCTATYIDRPRVFQEILWLLLCGCGVGFSVQFCHINKLPKFVERKKQKRKFIIQDSIEGWSDALGALIASYIRHPEFEYFEGCDIEFDYSKIRPKGSKLSYSTGKAPGPDGLKNSLTKITELLKKQSNTIDKLRPIDAYDIVMHASDAVLSGGIRRSATICLFSHEDKEMMNAKIGSWFVDNPQRARSNNSVVLIKDKVTKEQFSNIIKSTKEFGEPGFALLNSEDEVYNPCQPSWASVLTPKGISTIGEIEIGDQIWSETGWTKVVNKWSTGKKRVFAYRTTFGTFYGTENHRVISNGNKIEAKDAESIDLLRGVDAKLENNWNSPHCDSQFIMDGLVFGDGSFHAASNNLVYLCIGQNDTDYFEDENIKNLIIQKREGLADTAWEILTNIKYTELPRTYERIIPKRYIQADEFNKCGFLRGLYSANGSICNNRVTLKAASFDVIKDVQLMLSSIGIASYYTTNKPSIVHFENGDYHCKQSYDLNITRDIDKFYRHIGFIQKYKTEKLKKLLDTKTKQNWEKKSKDIIAVEEISYEEVFDITVDNELHTYWTGGLNVSNCFEIGMRPIDLETGQTGFQGCNLTEINGDKIKNEEDFLEAVKAATIIGTIQAGYTDFPYLGEVTERIFKREALLGVSITGMMHNTNIIFNPEIQKKAAKYAKKINKIIADKININQAARVTCIKPAGSTSCILGTSSGIHPHHAKRYIRRVQANKLEKPLEHFKLSNPLAVEESIWSTNKTDDVISFCVEVPDGIKTKNCLNAVELLELVKLTQENWVNYGKNEELCTDKNLSHNVSNTITVKEDEWEDVVNFIYKNRKYFSGISLLSASGDKDYAQAPFTTVHTPKEIVEMYGDASIFASGMIESAKLAFNNNLWQACDCILGLSKPQNEKQSEWVTRATNFADKYFDKNIRDMTYCLKDVANWYLWVNLKKSYKEVDFSLMIEEDDNTSFEAESACSGGKCELV